ncbi:DUF924 family protein [Roseateles violae]|uniref:DUF924 family protein n=1 Tax=Roseateles violae TaxID=3058042 RepID=A0ABT8DP77_9BURK|nr:DUF924 family protein [Pelomonas sp. PFR6]MDN3920139.1 DUF924 family protein [Pelomonas sp. PFR6]
MLTISHRKDHFEAEVEGRRVELDYLRHADQLVFHHTGTDPALRGRGLAAEIVEHALQWAAPQGLQLVASCSYVVGYLQRHPRWLRLTEASAVQQVLNFWFGPLGSESDGQVRAEWFQKNAAFDAEIAARFGPLIERLLAQGLQDWPETPLARVAAIVVLDQFTRNSFRGQAKAFAGDALALQTSLALLHGGAELGTLQRWFALMPLEHAEDLAMQERSVREFEALAAADPRLNSALDYARRHLDVIARFGRFPHRNAALGRSSTAEELDYLARPGAGF